MAVSMRKAGWDPGELWRTAPNVDRDSPCVVGGCRALVQPWKLFCEHHWVHVRPKDRARIKRLSAAPAGEAEQGRHDRLTELAALVKAIARLVLIFEAARRMDDRRKRGRR